jgi:hypothetical protein
MVEEEKFSKKNLIEIQMQDNLSIMVEEEKFSKKV